MLAIKFALQMLLVAQARQSYEVNSSTTPALDLLPSTSSSFGSIKSNTSTLNPTTRLSIVSFMALQVNSTFYSKSPVAATGSTLNVSSSTTVQIRSSNKTTKPNNMHGFTKETLEALMKLLEIESYLRIVDFIFGAASFLMLVFLKLPKTTKFFVHKNLVFGILINDLFVMTIGNSKIKVHVVKVKGLCIAMTITGYYLTLFLLAWMTVEAVNICMMLFKVFDTQSKSRKHLLYALFGYGSPAIIAIVAVSVKWDQFSNSFDCNSLKERWIMKAPSAAYLLVITILFFYIIGIAIRRICSSVKYDGGFQKFIGSIRSFLVLYPVMGFSFAIGFAHELDVIISGYFYVFCNGVLGILFFIFHVLLDSQVKDVLKKKHKMKMHQSGINGNSATARRTVTTF